MIWLGMCLVVALVVFWRRRSKGATAPAVKLREKFQGNKKSKTKTIRYDKRGGL